MRQTIRPNIVASLLPWLAGLLILTAPPFACAAASQTCYMPDGNVSVSLVSCNPAEPISQCCSSSDFCLSNGLCLNAGGNNGYSVQGCTDKTWSAPCNLHCALSKIAYDGMIYLQLCSGLNGVDNPFCCGQDYTCCGIKANVITTIPLWETLSRPGGIEWTQQANSLTKTSPPVTSTGTTNTQITSGTSSLTSTPSPTSPAFQTDNTGAPTAGDADKKTLAVGAGVGVPLGVALVAALGFLGWQLRKQNAARKMAEGVKVEDSSYFASSGTGSGTMAHVYPSPYTAGLYEAQGPAQTVQELHHTTTMELHGNPIKEIDGRQVR